jgi:Arc/MetJ family transcription regulator
VFATGNLVFPRRLSDAWALYRLQPTSYDGLGTGGKVELLAALARLLHTLQTDVTLHRVTRAWSPDDYEQRAIGLLDGRHGHPDTWAAHLAVHRDTLEQRAIVRPEVWLCVRLTEGRPSLGQAVRELVGWEDPAGLSERALRELATRERAVHERIDAIMPCTRGSVLDLQWLCARAFTRGLPEPVLDVHHRPQALVLAQGDELRYQPLAADLHRWSAPVHDDGRVLRIPTEEGESFQAQLALGALPTSVAFPGHGAELLFAPLEGLGFPIDATVCARHVPNERAAALVRRKVMDADNIYGEEAQGAHGATTDGARRPHAARALEDYLAGDARPPLLHATVTLALSAPSPELLEECVAETRAAYAPVRLHRPLGAQRSLFLEHFPGHGTQVGDYADYLLVEQLGAMVPTATTHVGPDRGAYIGHTLTASRQPVLHDPTEASRTSRPPATLLAGTLGSGKTIALQLLLYQAFLQGARVVDIDPKGDHRLDQLPGMTGHVEEIELTAGPEHQGLLDPLRIAPPGTGEDLAVSFLCDVLPQPIAPEWRAEIRRAVRTVAQRGDGTACCQQVIRRLREGEDPAPRVAGVLEVYADTGLAQLGFATPHTTLDIAGGRQVTSLRIRNLPRPLPGTPKAELSEEERIGQAVLRLLVAYAMHLMGSDRSRHKALGFDEAWFLLSDAAGRRLIEHLNRWGRSENATPFLVTHLTGDARELDNLIGTRLVFGMESEKEARAALELLRLDPSDERHRQRLLGFRKGACLMRDLHGQVAPVQIDPADPELLHILDTTPPNS